MKKHCLAFFKTPGPVRWKSAKSGSTVVCVLILKIQNIANVCTDMHSLHPYKQGRDEVSWHPGQRSKFGTPMFEAEVFRK